MEAFRNMYDKIKAEIERKMGHDHPSQIDLAGAIHNRLIHNYKSKLDAVVDETVRNLHLQDLEKLLDHSTERYNEIETALVEEKVREEVARREAEGKAKLQAVPPVVDGPVSGEAVKGLVEAHDGLAAEAKREATEQDKADYAKVLEDEKKAEEARIASEAARSEAPKLEGNFQVDVEKVQQ